MPTNAHLLLPGGFALTLADAATKPVWIQLAKTGSWRGHPAGPFALNEKIFREIVRNFEATENRQIPVDFEHASESPGTEGEIPTVGAPAQGWIRKLEIRGDKLFGLVEWLEPAKSYIRAGRYKYLSPAIRFASRDRETGELVGARMTSCGLTNSPFIDGMMPLAAKDGAARNARIAELEAKEAELLAEIAALERGASALPPSTPPRLTLQQLAEQLARARGISFADASVLADELARRNRTANEES